MKQISEGRARHTFGAAEASLGSVLAHGAGILLLLLVNLAVLVGIALLTLAGHRLDTLASLPVPTGLAPGAGSFQGLALGVLAAVLEFAVAVLAIGEGKRGREDCKQEKGAHDAEIGGKKAISTWAGGNICPI